MLVATVNIKNEILKVGVGYVLKNNHQEKIIMEQSSKEQTYSTGKILLTTILAAGLGLSSMVQAAPPSLPHGFGGKQLAQPKYNISTPVSTTPVRQLCPALGVVSFKIIGTVPVTGKSGDRSYRLRLQGVVKNFGDGYRGAIGKVKIKEEMQGARRKVISHQRPHNMAHGKQLMIGVLTQPFSQSTEFLPTYYLVTEMDRQFHSKSCLNNRGVQHQIKITPQMVRAALPR
jgi:hypothetical protein